MQQTKLVHRAPGERDNAIAPEMFTARFQQYPLNSKESYFSSCTERQDVTQTDENNKTNIKYFTKIAFILLQPRQSDKFQY
jgi:hypothetical protein